VRGHLLPISGLLAHKATAKPGPFAWAVRLFRGLTKAMIRPWLDFQTRFNHGVVEQCTELSDNLRFSDTTKGEQLGKLHWRVAWAENAVAELREALDRLTVEQREARATTDRLRAAGEQQRIAYDQLKSAHSQLQGGYEELKALAGSATAEERHERLAGLMKQELAELGRRIEAVAATHLGEQAAERLRAEVAAATAEAEGRLARECWAAVNRELSDEGEIARAGLWFNPPVGVRLVEGVPTLLAVTERIVEHGFIQSRIPPPPATVFDMGCAESTTAIELASRGYKVTGVDLRRLPIDHPNFTQVQANLGALPFPDAAFDVVVCLSTVEHVGLGWYTPGDEATDVQAMREAIRVLRPGGTLLITIPFGKPAVTPVHRVYDRAGAETLLAGLQVKEWSFAVRDGEAWMLTADGEQAGQVESAPRVGAVALIVAEKP
jgi:SAM-dependent methyltransferase